MTDRGIEIGIPFDFLREIDDAILAERINRVTRLRVQCDQLVARRYGEDLVFAARRSSTATPRLFFRTPSVRTAFVETPYP